MCARHEYEPPEERWDIGGFPFIECDHNEFLLYGCDGVCHIFNVLDLSMCIMRPDPVYCLIDKLQTEQAPNKGLFALIRGKKLIILSGSHRRTKYRQIS